MDSEQILRFVCTLYRIVAKGIYLGSNSDGFNYSLQNSDQTDCKTEKMSD